MSITVDGVWSSWQNWGPCYFDGSEGVQHREKSCIGPFHGGLACPGEVPKEDKSCTDYPCKQLFFLNLSNAKNSYKGEWATWTGCDCVSQLRERKMICATDDQIEVDDTTCLTECSG